MLKSLPVGGHNSTKPVKRISRGGVGNSIERNLAAHQVHKEGHNGPEATLTERNLDMSNALNQGYSHLLLRVLHLREISAKGFADVEKINYNMLETSTIENNHATVNVYSTYIS